MHCETFPIPEQTHDWFLELARKEAPDVEVVVLDVG